MKFYNKNHKHYCGIDLHTRMMYVCILDAEGNILIHKNIPTQAKAFLTLIMPYREDLIVGVECIFSWYWLADLCAREEIEFILGHALYMRCIHGGKTKNDKIDSEKIARLIRSGGFPTAYVYPPEYRPVRDLMRRRLYLVRFKSELLTHIQITRHQYNIPSFEKSIKTKANRKEIETAFTEPLVRKNVEVDLSVMDALEEEIKQLENTILRHARRFNNRLFYRLQTVPGIGPVLALTILYEVHDIVRFPTVQNFCSYSRLVKCTKESAGKKMGSSGSKIGNAHLKWAFSQAAVLLMKESDRAKAFVDKKAKQFGKGKAMSVLAHKLGRAVYFMMKRNDAFDESYFFSS